LGSYAGYFEGDVKVTKKVMSVDSGDADMKAYIYGKITTSTTGAIIVTSASSDGFTVERTAIGEYKVTFGNNLLNYDKYMVISTMDSTSKGFISVSNYNGYFKVLTYAIDGNAADRFFTFVVYKK
jgi:hypothetical protein